ncbi:hypothetical protein QEN29_25870 [Escherichia coli]|nr:hypothetical protein QEN29_25870 [Escherichia coli]
MMDKGANALAQQTLRELYTEELKKTKENEWLQKWFHEEHTEREIIEHLEETEGLKKPTGCVVMLFQKNHQIEEIAGNLYFLVSCRSIFQRAGFYLIVYEHQGQTLFILLNTRKVEDWKERAEKAANDITQLYDREKPGEAVINYGIGSYCEQFQSTSESFHRCPVIVLLLFRTHHSHISSSTSNDRKALKFW